MIKYGCFILFLGIPLSNIVAMQHLKSTLFRPQAFVTRMVCVNIAKYTKTSGNNAAFHTAAPCMKSVELQQRVAYPAPQSKTSMTQEEWDDITKAITACKKDEVRKLLTPGAQLRHQGTSAYAFVGRLRQEARAARDVTKVTQYQEIEFMIADHIFGRNSPN